MPVQRLNHAVLYVRDVERSHAFYRDVLGFRAKMEIPGAAVFLQAEGSTNDHDLGLFQIGAGAGPVRGRPPHRRALPPGVGGRHARRAVPDPRRAAAGRRAGRRLRPRHHQGALRPGPRRPRVRGLLAAAGRPDHARGQPQGAATIAPLDLDREIARYGAQTRGGVGVSVPV